MRFMVTVGDREHGNTVGMRTVNFMQVKIPAVNC